MCVGYTLSARRSDFSTHFCHFYWKVQPGCTTLKCTGQPAAPVRKNQASLERATTASVATPPRKTRLLDCDSGLILPPSCNHRVFTTQTQFGFNLVVDNMLETSWLPGELIGWGGRVGGTPPPHWFSQRWFICDVLDRKNNSKKWRLWQWTALEVRVCVCVF